MSEMHTAQQAAVEHILTSPAIDARARAHMAGADVDWQGLLAEAETMSVGQRLLVDVAHDVWTGNGAVSLQAVARRLGAGSFERVVEALRISRGEQASLGAPLRSAA